MCKHTKTKSTGGQSINDWVRNHEIDIEGFDGVVIRILLVEWYVFRIFAIWAMICFELFKISKVFLAKVCSLIALFKILLKKLFEHWTYLFKWKVVVNLFLSSFLWLAEKRHVWNHLEGQARTSVVQEWQLSLAKGVSARKNYKQKRRMILLSVTIF